MRGASTSTAVHGTGLRARRPPFSICVFHSLVFNAPFPSRDVLFCDMRIADRPGQYIATLFFSSKEFLLFLIGIAVSTYSSVKVDGVLAGHNVGDGRAAALLSSLRSGHFLLN